MLPKFAHSGSANRSPKPGVGVRFLVTDGRITALGIVGEGRTRSSRSRSCTSLRYSYSNAAIAETLPLAAADHAEVVLPVRLFKRLRAAAHLEAAEVLARNVVGDADRVGTVQRRCAVLSTSRRPIAIEGMALMSTPMFAVETCRRPLMSTRERCGPRPRRLIVATPSLPCPPEPLNWFVSPRLPLEIFRFRIISVIVGLPLSIRSSCEIRSTGSVASCGVPRMNDPVTTTSSISSAAIADPEATAIAIARRRRTLPAAQSRTYTCSPAVFLAAAINRALQRETYIAPTLCFFSPRALGNTVGYGETESSLSMSGR